MERCILITGGELFNKGAQSMSFITIDELRNRFPDKEIILLSDADFARSEDDKEQYSFKILPINLGLIFELLGGVYKLIWRFSGKKSMKEKNKSFLPMFKELLNCTDAIVDISGFALSSQWGFRPSVGYLAKIIIAKKFGIKFYIMPQSFGPFLYKGVNKIIVNYLIRKYLTYPEVIYAREKEGYEFLHRDYGLNNVKKSNDLVLLSKKVNLMNIYKSIPKIAHFENAKGVAIVPNMRNFDHGNTEQIMSLYDIIIKKLTDMGKTVCLVRHSYEDIEVCRMIKERFVFNDKVVLIDDDMSCIEFDDLIKNFEFLIGSRYHSIVHSYKNGVPCIAIGWARKYYELLETFKQEEYIFDVRNNINLEKIEKAIDLMTERRQKESEIIISVLKEIQFENIFDVM